MVDSITPVRVHSEECVNWMIDFIMREIYGNVQDGKTRRFKAKFLLSSVGISMVMIVILFGLAYLKAILLMI